MTDPAPPPSIGAQIRALRKRRLGVTQAGLAMRLGRAKRTVINWELGVTEPDAGDRLALAALAADLPPFGA